MPEHHDLTEGPAPRALIVTIHTPQKTDVDVDASCLELERLANTLGIEVVGREVQKRANTRTSTYFGEGKLEEIKANSLHDVDMVLVDDELSPSQQRTLARELEVEVFDRTAVILRIFESRAQTRESRLELELARLQYDMPRLRDDVTVSDRAGGGGGRGARGDTALALSKQQRRDRRAALKKELAEIQATEASRRDRRQDTFQVALVGYTNAGKSSMMRALTGSEVLVEDKLFATLGTTVRQLAPPATPAVLISDTVGFINNLPTELVASFRSTLDEAKDADFLLFVVDASDPHWRVQLAVTRDTLAGIGASDIASLVVLNKSDMIDEEIRQALGEELPEAVIMSAHNPDDVSKLRDLLLLAQEKEMREETLLIPYRAGELVGEIHARSRVLDESHNEEGTLFRLQARPAMLAKWEGVLKRFAKSK